MPVDGDDDPVFSGDDFDVDANADEPAVEVDPLEDLHGRYTMLCFLPDSFIDKWKSKKPPVPSQLGGSEKLQAYSGLYNFVRIIASEHPDLAKQFKVRSLPTCVFMDEFGNVYTQVVKRLSPTELVSCFDACDDWQEMYSKKFQRSLDKALQYEEKENRKAAVSSLLRVVENKQQIIGIEPIEEASELLDSFLQEARLELNSLVDGYSQENAEATLANLSDLANVYTPLKVEIRKTIKTLKSQEDVSAN